MRLNAQKIEKMWGDGNARWNRMHSAGLAPYNMDIMFADDRAKRFTGSVDGLIAKNNWIPLGEESSQVLMRRIRDAKTSPKTYSIMTIDGTTFDTQLIYDYIRHYQRASDVIHLFSMGKDKPLLLTTNEEWCYVIAPRIEPREKHFSKSPYITLFNPPADALDEEEEFGGEIESPKTFNPITGEFE